MGYFIEVSVAYISYFAAAYEDNRQICKSQPHRNRRGQHQTPPRLAAEISAPRCRFSYSTPEGLIALKSDSTFLLDSVPKMGCTGSHRRQEGVTRYVSIERHIPAVSSCRPLFLRAV